MPFINITCLYACLIFVPDCDLDCRIRSHRMQGNCTGQQPSLEALGITDTADLLELLPGQCFLGLSPQQSQFVFTSGTTWVDGVYFQMQQSSLDVRNRAWMTHSTFQWRGDRTENCSSCPDQPWAGINVTGELYVQGVISCDLRWARGVCETCLSKFLRCFEPCLVAKVSQNMCSLAAKTWHSVLSACNTFDCVPDHVSACLL